MTNFEERLRESAKRLTEEQNKQLKVPDCTRHTKKIYWGWVATPAAAVVGILFGMCLPFMLKQHEPLLSHQPKLEPVPKLIKDTIYLTKTDTQKIIQCDTVFRTRWIEQPLKDEAHEQDGFHEQECTSVQCDGINYALLVSN